jgi:hypothetical protein
MAMVALAAIISIKFKLDFHCRGEQGRPKAAANWINLGMWKCSTSGKEYLDYL